MAILSPAQMQAIQDKYKPADVSPKVLQAPEPKTSQFFGEALGEQFGIQPQTNNTDWENKPWYNKTWSVAAEGWGALKTVTKAIPKNIVHSYAKVGQLGEQALQKTVGTTVNAITGKELIPKVSDVSRVPYIGDVETYNSQYSTLRQRGMGPLAAGWVIGSNVVGDISVVAAITESLFKFATSPVTKTLIKSRNKIEDFRTKTLEANKEGVYQAKAPPKISVYPTTPAAANQFGGTAADTFVVVKTTGKGMLKGSIIRVKPSYLQQAKNWLKNNPEDLVANSEVISEQMVPLTGQAAGELSLLETQPTLLGPTVAETAAPLAVAATIPKTGVVIKPQQPLVSLPNAPEMQITLAKQADNTAVTAKLPQKLYDQIKWGMTGKLSTGDMTPDEVQMVQGGIKMFEGLTPAIQRTLAEPNFTKLVTPTGYTLENIEIKDSTQPVYSQIYHPAEEADIAIHALREVNAHKLRRIFGGFTPEQKIAIGDALNGDIPVESLPEKAQIVVGSARILLDQYYEMFGIKQGYRQNYLSHIPRDKTFAQVYGDKIPENLKLFADMERTGVMVNRIRDPEVLMNIYVQAAARRMFYNPVLENYKTISPNLAPGTKDLLDKYLNTKIFSNQGKAYKDLVTTAKNVSQSLYDVFNPNQISSVSFADEAETIVAGLNRIFMSTTYSGALGLRASAVFMNLTPLFLMTGAEMGFPEMTAGLKMFLQNPVRAYKNAVEEGWIPEFGFHQIPREGKTKFSKAIDFYEVLTKSTLTPFQIAEITTRVATIEATKIKFITNLRLLQEGKITQDEFNAGINTDGLGKIQQQIFAEKMATGQWVEAERLLIRDTLDRSQAPTRRGAGIPLTYTKAGKALGQFSQYGTNWINTVLRSWIGRGQWMKIIRYMAASHVMNDSAKEAGIDTSNLGWLGPAGMALSPAATLIFNAFKAFASHNDEELANVKKQLKQSGTIAIPAGLQIKNTLKFFEEAKDNFMVKDANGKALYQSDWKREAKRLLGGFQDLKRNEYFDTLTNLSNKQFYKEQVAKEAARLMMDGKTQEANDLIINYFKEEGGVIKITPTRLENYLIPQWQRILQGLKSDPSMQQWFMQEMQRLDVIQQNENQPQSNAGQPKGKSTYEKIKDFASNIFGVPTALASMVPQDNKGATVNAIPNKRIGDMNSKEIVFPKGSATIFAKPVDNKLPNFNNNALNLQWNTAIATWVPQLGGSKGKSGYVKFESPEGSLLAAKRMFISPNTVYKDKTVDNAVLTWSHKDYSVKELKAKYGLTINTNKKLHDLSEADVNKLIYSMAWREGFKQLDKVKQFLKISD